MNKKSHIEEDMFAKKSYLEKLDKIRRRDFIRVDNFLRQYLRLDLQHFKSLILGFNWS
jgi:hypothetical protein